MSASTLSFYRDSRQGKAASRCSRRCGVRGGRNRRRERGAREGRVGEIEKRKKDEQKVVQSEASPLSRKPALRTGTLGLSSVSRRLEAHANIFGLALFGRGTTAPVTEKDKDPKKDCVDSHRRRRQSIEWEKRLFSFLLSLPLFASSSLSVLLRRPSLSFQCGRSTEAAPGKRGRARERARASA